jgi:hypothetical protein
MNLFSRLFRARRAASNLTTELERARLSRTMPGQTGAMAAARFGFIVN